MIDIDPKDAAIQTTVPTVMVPRYSELSPLQGSGHRFLSASDGLWVEVRRPWMHLVWPVAQQYGFPMPYGELSRKVQLSFDKIPDELMRQFIEDACLVFPHECAAWLVWDERKSGLEYWLIDEVIDADSGRIEFRRPPLKSHQSLAVELHSHGTHPAFFSPEDNADDRYEVKIAGVIGSLHKERLSVAFRICTGGGFIDLGDAGFRE